MLSERCAQFNMSYRPRLLSTVVFNDLAQLIKGFSPHHISALEYLVFITYQNHFFSWIDAIPHKSSFRVENMEICINKQKLHP